MKIVEIIPQLASGGAERFVVDLCNELAREHSVTLIVFHSASDFYVDDLSKNVRLVLMGKRAGLDLFLPFRLYRLLKKLDPDVVHTHLRAVLYASLFFILSSGHASYYHTFHTEADKESRGLINRCIRRLLFKRQRVVPITISEESRKSFEEYYGFVPRLIYNGRNIPHELQTSDSVDLEIEGMKFSPNDKVLVQLARFSDVKRQDLMARIAKRLDDEGMGFVLLMIGREDEEISKKVQMVGCRRVFVLGERHNPLEYLKASDAYCLCSSYEGLPISLIEAMGVGTIPVCTPVGGVVNVIDDGVNGILAEDISEEAYYKAIRCFFAMDISDVAKMKQCVQETSESYSMTKCADYYMDTFRNVCTGQKNDA